jgi:hypothetical protein
VTSGLCAVCRREGRGFGFDPALIGLKSGPLHACSMICLDIIARRRGTMIDPTPNERAAIRHAGEMGGEYLDSLGRTDLARLSEAEWLAFVEAVVTGYCDRLRDLAGRDRQTLARTTDEAPF